MGPPFASVGSSLNERIALCYNTGSGRTAVPGIEMYSSSNLCHQCGAPLSAGLANCRNCGAQVGTVFSEEAVQPDAAKTTHRRKVAEHIDHYQIVEKARDRANNSLILGLASFFCPGAGFIMGSVAVYFGYSALKNLKACNIEEGRGFALAGVVTGVFGLLAQIFYSLYVIRSGLPF